MTGRSQVVAEPDGGSGSHVWRRSLASRDTYFIRRGPDMVAMVTLHESLMPSQSALLEGFCRVLDEAEREGS